MRDGHTRKLERSELKQSIFLARHCASLVVVDGPAAGTEYLLDQPSYTLGRGPAVDIVIPDDTMSKQHAALELSGEGYRLRDMGSTNGILVNGTKTAAADLKHGDKLRLGEHTLQYLVEKRERVGTYDLS